MIFIGNDLFFSRPAVTNGQEIIFFSHYYIRE
jgi:hypothetical protein